MKKTRTLGALGAVLSLSLALAACSGGGGGSGTDETTDASGGTGDNTLTVWAWDPAFNIYALEEAEKVYQEDNPDFKLEIVETPWEDLQTKLTTLAQSRRDRPAARHLPHAEQRVPEERHQLPGHLRRLRATPTSTSASSPSPSSAYSTSTDVNYGVPFDNGTAIGAYRTDILEQAGYTIDDFTDITWDEFLTIGKDVLAKTGKPLLTGQAGSADTIMMMLQSAGASLFDDEGNPTITDNDALLAAIDMYRQLVEAGVFVEVNSWDEYIGTIVNSNTAGIVNGVWISGSIQSAADQSGKWAVTNVPKLDGVDGATNYTANGGSSWAITLERQRRRSPPTSCDATFAGSTEFYDTILPDVRRARQLAPGR